MPPPLGGPVPGRPNKGMIPFIGTLPPTENSLPCRTRDSSFSSTFFWDPAAERIFFHFSHHRFSPTPSPHTLFPRRRFFPPAASPAHTSPTIRPSDNSPANPPALHSADTTPLGKGRKMCCLSSPDFFSIFFLYLLFFPVLRITPPPENVNVLATHNKVKVRGRTRRTFMSICDLHCRR